jgi:hypothetical protein
MLSLSHSFYAVISFLFKSGMQVGAKMTSVRMVQVGGKYQMPPAAQGSPPSNFTGMLEWRSIVCATLEEKLIDSLVQAFQGVGPGLATELMAQAGLDANSVCMNFLCQWILFLFPCFAETGSMSLIVRTSGFSVGVMLSLWVLYFFVTTILFFWFFPTVC